MAISDLTNANSDPSVRKRWLVRLTAQGLDARYAEDEVEFGGYQWRKGLEVTGAPSIEGDAYEGRASLSPFSITIYPELEDPVADPSGQSLVELDVVASYGFGEVFVELWRVADGVDFTEQAVLVKGIADAPSMDANGSVTLQCTSFLDLYDRRLPLVFLEPRLHPSAYEDDAGAGYPILLGAYYRQECPVAHVANAVIIIGQEFAGHTMPDPTTFYNNDVATGWSNFEHYTDDDGNLYFCSDATSLGDPFAFLATGNGLRDDADGTYTGSSTADAPIVHPCDQLRFLAMVVCQIPDALVDSGSFANAKDLLPGWVYSISISSTGSESLIGIAENACKMMRAVMVPEHGRLSLRLLEFNKNPVMDLNATNILEPIDLQWGDKSKIATRYTMKYKWGWHSVRQESRYLSSLTYGPSDSLALELAEARYSERFASRQELETKNINDATTATAAITRYAQLREKMRRVVKVRCDGTTHDLKLFDNVLLDISTIPWWQTLDDEPKVMAVVAITYGLYENTLTLLEC